MSRQQREQLSALVRHNTGLVKQPKTQQEAVATRVNRADGTSVILVPESLWNNLSVQQDAHGNTQYAKVKAPRWPPLLRRAPRMNKPLMVLTLAITTVLFGSASRAADILPIPLDAAGQGYNDPTPVAPVPATPVPRWAHSG